MYWRFNRRRMDAEQLRDSVLSVAGNLDDSLGGPSEDLTPAFERRTVYGKVSRYKLDTYLQTFDFPPPNISAEKRFTTTVPLQRLFLMNSDFMQVEAEELARRVASEPGNAARIRKLYQIVYDRNPNEQEVKLGLDYLRIEPLKEYEENKKKASKRGPRSGGRKGSAEPPKEVTTNEYAAPETKPGAAPAPDGEGGAALQVDAKPAQPAADAAIVAPDDGAAKPGETEAQDETIPAAAGEDMPPLAENAGLGMGMMDGVGMSGRRGNAPAAPKVKYEPTVWGRYAKVLLSSTEFLFIN